MSTNAQPESPDVPLTAMVEPKLAARFHAVRKRMPFRVSASALLAQMIVDTLPTLEAKYPEPHGK